MLPLLVSALFACVIKTTHADCPKGFQIHDGSCYYFSDMKDTWLGAFESCKSFGAVLVEVNNAAQDSYLINRTASSGDSRWIGLASDKLIKAEYLWKPSMHLLTDDVYSNWALGEPYNHREENCVMYAQSKNYLWQGVDCNNTEHFICEKKTINFEIHDGSCYYFSDMKETWFGAYESCKSFGARLVEVNNAAEDGYLVNKTSSKGDSWWIGLTSDKLIKAEYLWKPSMHLLTDDVYSNWATGEPYNHRDDNCVMYAQSKNYLWQGVDCKNTEHFICEKGGCGNIHVVG